MDATLGCVNSHRGTAKQNRGEVRDNNGDYVSITVRLFLTKRAIVFVVFVCFLILAKALGPSMESNLLSISLGQFIMGMDAGPTIPNDGLP